MPQVEMLILIDSNTSFHFLLRFPLVSTEKKKRPKSPSEYDPLCMDE